MRLSADPKSIYYHPVLCNRRDVKFLFNGESMTHVLFVDDVAGTMKRYREHPETGEIPFVIEGKDLIATETLRGKVEIVYPKELQDVLDKQAAPAKDKPAKRNQVQAEKETPPDI